LKHASLNTSPEVLCPGTERNTMASQNSHVQGAPTGDGLPMRHRVHRAGNRPNAMNRFLVSNMQEVLFVT
jgi:hypothetical protein